MTIRGTSQNASHGAVVITESDTPVYINGIQEWDNCIVGKPIIVTGTLRRRSLVPKVSSSANGEVSHGIDGKSYILDNPKGKFDCPR